MKTYLSLCISLKKKREDLSRFFKKSSLFKYIFPRFKHVLNTFKLRTLFTRFYFFVVYISFVPVISTSTHRYVNFSDIKVLMMVTETETFNVNFTS